MWSVDLPLILRHCISDIDIPQTYSDQRLQELIVVTAQLVQLEVDFNQIYNTNVDTLSILPDPTDPNNKDHAFIKLVTYKAASILATSEAKIAAGQGIDIADGSSRISLKDVAKNRIEMAKFYKEQYEDTKFELKTVGMSGRIIGSPFRVWGAQAITYGNGPGISYNFNYVGNTYYY